MKVHYSSLKANHYSAEDSKSSYVSREHLYKEIGYSDEELLKQNLDYRNTCAVRMSLALLKSNIPFSGRLKIKSGKYAGKSVETGAKLLADQLCLGAAFGKPEIFKPADNFKKVSRRGVVFFWKIANYGGGHIDLIESINFGQVCNSHCYPDCKEIWFWQLP